MKPVCSEIRAWLNHHVGKGALAPCTGQDRAALYAFRHLLEMYAVGDAAGRGHALTAMACVVKGMQSMVRPLAKKLIPMALDWGDEEPLWAQIMEDVSMEKIRVW